MIFCQDLEALRHYILFLKILLKNRISELKATHSKSNITQAAGLALKSAGIFND